MNYLAGLGRVDKENYFRGSLHLRVPIWAPGFLKESALIQDQGPRTNRMRKYPIRHFLSPLRSSGLLSSGRLVALMVKGRSET